MFCGGAWSAEDHGVKHTDDCPTKGPDSGPIYPDKTEIVRSLDAARFNRASHPAHLNPRTALVAALEWYDAQEDKPQHIQVLVGRDVGDEGCSGTKFFQAGNYRHHGQMGLCIEAMNMLRESGQ